MNNKDTRKNSRKTNNELFIIDGWMGFVHEKAALFKNFKLAKSVIPSRILTQTSRNFYFHLICPDPNVLQLLAAKVYLSSFIERSCLREPEI